VREPSDRVLDAIATTLETTTDSLYEQAGMARDADEEPAAVAAVRADPTLTGRQKQALLEMYEAFVAANGGPRRRRRRRSSAAASEE
jgi:hypothetical protein